MATAAIPQHSDEVADMLAALDAALQVHHVLAGIRRTGILTTISPLATLMAGTIDHAEYAATLWASGHGATIGSHVSTYPDGTQIRSLDIIVGGARIASVQFDPEPIPVATDFDPSGWRPEALP